MMTIDVRFRRPDIKPRQQRAHYPSQSQQIGGRPLTPRSLPRRISETGSCQGAEGLKSRLRACFDPVYIQNLMQALCQATASLWTTSRGSQPANLALPVANRRLTVA